MHVPVLVTPVCIPILKSQETEERSLRVTTKFQATKFRPFGYQIPVSERSEFGRHYRFRPLGYRVLEFGRRGNDWFIEVTFRFPNLFSAPH